MEQTLPHQAVLYKTNCNIVVVFNVLYFVFGYILQLVFYNFEVLA